jgi:hypothetical protein
MKLNQASIVMLCLSLVSLAGCKRAGLPVAEATANPMPPATAPAPTFRLDAGVRIPVRLEEWLDTQRNRAGDHFTAVLDEPLVSGDRVIVPKGTIFSGHITQAHSSGRFKGRAVMALTLDSFQLNGRIYPVTSTTPAHQSRGHKMRNWLWMGGGGAGGATIGAAAAGGPGAVIGAGAGAAAGTVGAAFTGKQQVKLPTETRITFTLRAPIEIPT